MEIKAISPFPAQAIPRVWSWIETFRHRVADDFGPKTLAEFVDHWEAEGKLGMRAWGIYRDAELGGVVYARRISPVVANAHCIFKRSFWGHGTTIPALRMVFGEVYAEGASKISSLAFRDNRALIALIKELGGTIEGTLATHTMRGGKLTDMVVIGIQKERFNEFSSNAVQRERKPAGSGGRLRIHQRINIGDVQHHRNTVGNAEHSTNPDALPVLAPAAAVSVHHAVDAEPASCGGAVRKSGPQ